MRAFFFRFIVVIQPTSGALCSAAGWYGGGSRLDNDFSLPGEGKMAALDQYLMIPSIPPSAWLVLCVCVSFLEVSIGFPLVNIDLALSLNVFNSFGGLSLIYSKD